MNRHIAVITVVALAAALGTVARTLADDKQLENVKGSVSYQVPSQAAVPLAPSATIALADREYAITGGTSLAQVTLPDSSQVMVGSDTKVQLAFFDQTQIAHAKFVLYDGHVRFAVRHPAGAKANYTFTTATASIGVRGTQGDIALDSDGSMRVNVYEVCDPANPVEVTTPDGRTYTVTAGQSLAAHLVDGVVRAQVQQLTQELIDQFTPDFGVPTSWDAAKGEVVGYAQSQATTAVNNVTGGYGGQAVSALGGFLKHKATPAPSPAPTRSTC